MKLAKNEYIYINKEDMKWDDITGYQELYTVCEKYDTIFIDEIQEIKNREKAVRSLWAN